MYKKYRYAVFLTIFAVFGCDSNRVSGTVYDIHGNALPGVAVREAHTGAQDITSALGRYRVRYEPGQIVLHFIKTGYTPGSYEVFAPEGGEITAQSVHLWRLPASKGVYLYSDDRYIATKPVEVEWITTAEEGTFHGTIRFTPERRDAVHFSPERDFILLCYRMPMQNVQMHYLEQREVVLEGVRSGSKTTAWVRGEPVPVRVVPIDGPDGVLMQILPNNELLEPATYAIHWGALEGRNSREPRMFVFTITEDEVTDDQIDENEKAETT